MTEIKLKNNTTQIKKLEERLNVFISQTTTQIEKLAQRTYDLEKEHAVSTVQYENLVQRIDQLSNGVSEINNNLKKLVWIVVASLIGGSLTFVLQGGLVL